MPSDRCLILSTLKILEESKMHRKHKGQIEISDLMADAVSDAVARRDRALETEEKTLTTLSEDEVEAIRGGLKQPVCTTAGMIEVPEEVM
jgi:hypothetical protein